MVSGSTFGFLMQLLNPIQSFRVPFRDALRLQSWIFQAGGRRSRTNLSDRTMAFFCFTMQEFCHRQTKPMFNKAGSSIGGFLVRASALTEHVARRIRPSLNLIT